MERYKIVSLVDITKSGSTRSDTDPVKIGQQSNFNTLVQTIGLRANIDWSFNPKRFDGRFPEPIEGAGTFWIWEFGTERDQVFQKNSDPVGLLIDDLDLVPVAKNLTESIDLDPAVFKTQGKDANIWISIINEFN
jgi:hypothetical protein